MESRLPVALILLAAGGSTRLGRPKQLLEHQGRPLLCHAVETALASSCRPIIVVLGAEAEACAAALQGLDGRDCSPSRPSPNGPPILHIVINTAWKDGLASSIRAGISALEKESPNIAAAILSVADQPFLTATLLDSLIERQRATGAEIAAAEYAGKPGVPALFSVRLFSQLKALTGDEGARALLRRDPAAVARVPFPDGLVDVDTPADYQRLEAKTRGDK